VAIDKSSVSEVRERHVSVLVTLRVQKLWQEPAKDALVLVILREPIASRAPGKDVLVQESPHEVAVSGVWNAWEEENASLWSEVANVAHSCDGG
jgi:hypothetical protein